MRPSFDPALLWPLGAEALALLTAAVQGFAPAPTGSGLLTLGVLALVAAGTLAVGWLKAPDTRLTFTLVQAVLVFWSTQADPHLLAVRWLVHGALACQAGILFPGWGAAVLTLGLGVELTAVTHLVPGMTRGSPDPWDTFLAAALLAPAAWLGAAATRLAALRGQEKERIRDLQEAVFHLTAANSEFLGQANAAGEESAIQERHRITRDLHDVVGQTLTNIIMMMDAALHRGPGGAEDHDKLFRWVRKQAKAGLDETRAVLYELRSMRPDGPRGVKAFKKLIDTFSRLSKINTRVHWGNLPWTFDPAQERAVHHLLQASLSNAFRHGGATKIEIHFQVMDGLLNILVRDNGQGGSVEAGGIGQKGMAERLAPWGGTVRFRSEPSGYAVLAEVPLVPDESLTLDPQLKPHHKPDLKSQEEAHGRPENSHR